MSKKSLFLLRHAKAITGEVNMPDQDRPLSDMGFKQATQLGEKIFKKVICFDIILSSPAIRAITTAQLLINRLDLNGSNILIDPRIYQADDQATIELISKFNKKYDHLLVIGHNPGLAGLASRISGKTVAIPTCCLTKSIFEFKDWRKILIEKSTKFSFIN